MVLKIIESSAYLKKKYFNRWGRSWVNKKISAFLPFIHSSDKVLDIGSGSGLVTQSIRDKGIDCSPLDVANLSYDERVKPIVYDGENMPFEDKAFDVSLILTVLHHTPNPEAVLAEAVRVSKKIIIVEDIYDNKVQQYLTYFMDTLVNLGYSKCTYTNKNDAEWKACFEAQNLQLLEVQYRRVLFFFKQGTYYLSSL